MYYIGIDSGKHTGFAVWDSVRGKFLCIETMLIHQAMERIKDYDLIAQKEGTYIHVIVEDARQRGYLPREKSRSEYRGKLMGAGSVKRDATIWEDFLRDYDYNFTMQAPAEGCTKWSAEYFKSVTGWKGGCSEHARDAALLVFHR